MAEETFNELYSRYNTDDVFNRVVIIGLLDLLNHKLKYNQIWDDNVVEEVTVPFMYDFGSSDERFAQDNYAFFGTTCFNEKKITGKFDMLPRGAIKYSSSSIDAGNITNRFIKGTFLKNENGKLTSYTGDMYSIPLTFNFECEMWIDNIITAFKIEQALREAFYKNKSYYVLYKGMKVSCCAGFPESSSIEKTTTYSFDSERQIKLTFSIAVETYQPTFDLSTVIESSNRIEHIGFDVEIHNARKDYEKPRSVINILNKYERTKLPAGISIPINWAYTSDISDMPSVAISYINNKTGVEQLVTILDSNSRYFEFFIPDAFAVYEQPIIVINDMDMVVKEPIIKLVPVNGEITAESFKILNDGKFTFTSGLLPLTLEILNEDGSVTINDSYSLNIINDHLNTISPVVINGETLKCKNFNEPNNISVKVYNPANKEIFDQTANILII